jgi:hypothetical protein
MARDRIKRVLQVIFFTQKSSGYAKDLSHDRKRIPPYYQNANGDGEGIFFHGVPLDPLI